MSSDPKSKKDKPEPPPMPKTLPKIVLYCHLYQDLEKGIIQSVKVRVGPEIKRIKELKEEIDKNLRDKIRGQNIRYKILDVYKSFQGNAFTDENKIRMYFEDKNDVYVKVKTEVIPVHVQKQEEAAPKDIVLSYKSITSYSFYVSSEKYVRVLVPIPGIENVKKEDIIANFTEDSLEVKVLHGANGLNYRFAVPKLDSKIIPEYCDTLVKGKDLVIKLRKFKNDDHWSYLFKQKYVGE